MTHLAKMNHLKIVPPVCEAWVANGGKMSKMMKSSPELRNPTDVLVQVSAASVNPLGKYSIALKAF